MSEFTGSIPFDADAQVMKKHLEALATIDEVSVIRECKNTGFQWTVTFTKQLGNLPSLIPYSRIFSVQTIEIVGGDPTPLGGFFTLSYMHEMTPPLPFDVSASGLKVALEAFSSIDRVDISQVILTNGQRRWMVTFRDPVEPAELVINATFVTGTISNATSVRTTVPAVPISLRSLSGSAPVIQVQEKIAGLPSYTGRYLSSSSGSYLLAVLQLQCGGLQGYYYDNIWLQDQVVLQRVDAYINFNWGNSPITKFGRDFISIRWWGKLKPKSSERYTFYVISDDGLRLFIDHLLLVDTWNSTEVGKERRASIELTAGNYHDIRLEYKEETGKYILFAVFHT
jgi:hypothetical protein